MLPYHLDIFLFRLNYYKDVGFLTIAINKFCYWFQNVLEALNSLQTNANVLHTLKNTIPKNRKQRQNLEMTEQYLEK